MIQIIVLIGNICSGKSTFANILENKGFVLFPVETVKSQLNFKEKQHDKNQELLYREYAKQIINLGGHQKLIVESTGGNKFWPSCYQKIKEFFGEKSIYIKIDTNANICLSRLKTNKTGHRLNTREELIPKIEKILSTESKVDLCIKNNGTKQEFIDKSNKILSQLKL